MTQTRIRNYLALGLAFSSPAVCGTHSSYAAEPIVGGKSVASADPVEKSVVALYQKTSDGGSLCTATLVGKEFALTAAHCVQDGIQDMVVLFGTDVRTSLAKRKAGSKEDGQARVVDVRVAPQWKGEETESDQDWGDIALVRLEGELPQGYHSAQLATSRSELKKGETVTLAGYGIDDSAGDSGEGDLRKATVKIANPDFSQSEILLDQSAGSGACHGDSGGPAFAKMKGKLVVVGVTSRGYPDDAPDDCQHQSIYTKVSAYRPWMASAMKEMRASK